MGVQHLRNLLHITRYLRRQDTGFHMRVVLYHSSEEDSHEQHLPSDWYEKAFPKLKKLSHLLRNVDSVDGRLINVSDHSIVADDSLRQNMHSFKSLARAFLGSPMVQQALRTQTAIPPLCFSKPTERNPMTINSLTKVCNFLNISAQQRKLIRLAICPQVTQHQIWIGTLEEILTGLKWEIEVLGHRSPNKGIKMGQQIVSGCLKFLDTAVSYDPNSTSWMRLSPSKPGDSTASHKWEDVLEMFNDLMNCMRNDKDKLFHFPKLEVMKEGLLKIKDVVVDKNIGHRETKHQESLMKKKLTKTLGHSSRCLFTLLIYYLYGSVGDVEVEISGGVYESGEKDRDRFCLCMGKILASDEDKMVRSGVKQMNRALALFKYVWETSGMKGDLEIQGHLWCVGAEEKAVTHRGNRFFVHGIRF